MKYMQTRVDIGSIKKAIWNTLIPPESQATPRTGAMPGPKALAKRPADQGAEEKEKSGREASLSPELSVKTPDPGMAADNPYDFSQKHLQDVIIWSEIIGKPVCKKRKRRQYGD